MSSPVYINNRDPNIPPSPVEKEPAMAAFLRRPSQVFVRAPQSRHLLYAVRNNLTSMDRSPDLFIDYLMKTLWVLLLDTEASFQVFCARVFKIHHQDSPVVFRIKMGRLSSVFSEIHSTY